MNINRLDDVLFMKYFQREKIAEIEKKPKQKNSRTCNINLLILISVAFHCYFPNR